MDDPDLVTDIICNPSYSLIGVKGKADFSNGRMTELTAISVPIFGGISASQLSDYQQYP